MSYIATLLPAVLVSLANTFLGSNRHQTINFESPETANALLERQTATVDAMFTAERCTGFSVGYMIKDSYTINSGQAIAAATCAVAGTDTFSTVKADYALTRQFKKSITVARKDCDNAIKFKERMAYAMIQTGHEIALQINQRAIEFLTANKQTATNTGDYGTINAGVVEYNKADIQNNDLFEQIMADWYLLGIQEKLPSDLFAMNGNTFFSRKRLAEPNNANQNQKSQLLNFGMFDMGWDVLGFGITRADIKDTSFLVDKNNYVFFCHNQFTPVMQQVGDSLNTVVYSIPLQYVGKDANGAMMVKTMMYNLNGVMTPVMVDVRVQEACNTTDSVNGLPTYDYKIDMQVIGDFMLAPVQAGSTGIVQIDVV
jgi:hypothetical protein